MRRTACQLETTAGELVVSNAFSEGRERERERERETGKNCYTVQGHKKL